MNKILEVHQKLSLIKIKQEDTYGVAYMKGGINGLPLVLIVGGLAHVVEKAYKKSKK